MDLKYIQGFLHLLARYIRHLEWMRNIRSSCSSALKKYTKYILFDTWGDRLCIVECKSAHVLQFNSVVKQEAAISFTTGAVLMPPL
jgi:hypothetical protein